MYARTGHPNTKYNTKYFFLPGTGHSNTKYNSIHICFAPGSLWDTLCRFAKINYDLTTQLSIIITGLLNQNFACNVSNISKMSDQSGPVNARMHYVVFTVTSSGCQKLYLNPWESYCELSVV